MSLSGSNTGALRPFTAQNLLEEACSRAGIPPEAITSEIVEKSLDQINLLFTSLLNRGIQLWKRQQLLMPCYESVSQIELPPGYNVVTTLNRRTMSRQTDGTAFTSAGGTASYAFDDDFETICTQSTANGSIGMEFDEETVVTTVGILSGTSGEFGIFYEYSDDGVTYTAVDAQTFTFSAAGEWAWYDLDGSPAAGALFWRVRSVGDVPFAAAEIYFGNTPQEINLGPWNIDDYSNMPNKAQSGPVQNWYQQRNIDGPTLYVWPAPSTAARYDILVMWATQYLDQVSEITQALDLPLRWYDAITAMLARRLCRSLKEADIKRYQMLTAEEQEAVWLATAEERDPAPTNYDFGVYNYTA